MSNLYDPNGVIRLVATIIGNPGFSAYRRAALMRVLAVLGTTVLAALIMWGIAYAAGRYGFCALLLVGTLFVGEVYYFRAEYADMLKLWGEGGNWWKGAEGERALSDKLKGLPSEYIVFNDYHPLGKDGRPAAWNVDHIVVGPSGVFVLDAKNYSAQRVASAAHSSFSGKNARQAKRNALDLKDKLMAWSGGDLDGLFVVPVVVYVQADVRLETSREGPVRVATLRTVNAVIRNHVESAIDMEKVIRIATVLRSEMSTNDSMPFEADFQRFCRNAREAVKRERAAVKVDALLGGSPVATRADAAQAPATRACPRCGGMLVRRTANRGPHKGEPFLGCSAYPRCRYLERLEA